MDKQNYLSNSRPSVQSPVSYLLDEEDGFAQAGNLGWEGSLEQLGSSGLVGNVVQAVDRPGVIPCDVQVETHRLRGKAHECDRNLPPHLLSHGNGLVVVEEVAVRVLAVAVEPVESGLVRWEQQHDVRRVVVMLGQEMRIRTTTNIC